MRKADELTERAEQRRERETREETRPWAGLEILYAMSEGNAGTDVARRSLAAELRERYWIAKAKDGGLGGVGPVLVEGRFEWEIDRGELGRSRNDPGDGFRYVWCGGTAGTGGRAEWFEVTEVFECVHPGEINQFMRMHNGDLTVAGFDAEGFLKRVPLGIPSRAAQRRAADNVLSAIKKKLEKRSYENMAGVHGYGTLIVGLPLWFAVWPADPLRLENVVDDFVTRVVVGLRPYERQFKSRRCPFWRIVVVWETTDESIREWLRRARLDIYRDPGLWTLAAPFAAGALLPTMVESGGKLTMQVSRSRPEKTVENVELPAKVAAVARVLGSKRWGHGLRLRERMKLRAAVRLLELSCFLRLYGLGGLERWAIGKFSPTSRLRGWVLRRGAYRLYGESVRRGR